MNQHDKNKQNSGGDEAAQSSLNLPSAPTIQLPKGGGAIKGIGEKFAANPVTGTGSMAIPIAVSPGRSNFGPQFSLSYDSGSGNGPFGMGWSLSLPSITRKTDKGLPQYNDSEESDVFILSNAEDLVPVFKKDEEKNWILDDTGNYVIDEFVQGDYRIRRYQPRIEGVFARIERWILQTKEGEVPKEGEIPGVHWRSCSRDNILTLYGTNKKSRIVDPNDDTCIFSWLISESRDDKGNAIIYEYKEEDSVGVDLAQAHERNRGDKESVLRKVNRYIKRIYYGNRNPLLNTNGKRPHVLTSEMLTHADWMFEVVFDYGEHSPTTPAPREMGEWFCRKDPFSSYRSGFEVRAYRLCQRVLMFHHFPNEDEVNKDCLVRSTDFTYRNIRNNSQDTTLGHPVASFISSVTQSGYKRSGNTYLQKSFPPAEFEYSEAVINEKVETIDPDSLKNLPIGIDGSLYQWVDLFGEGVPGIFTEQGEGWFYKRNLSPGIGPNQASESKNQVQLAPLEALHKKPNISMAVSHGQFMDLEGDGQPDVVMLGGTNPGFFEVTENEEWAPFRPFLAKLNLSPTDPNIKFLDLNGDGHADALLTEDHVFIWYPSLGEEGFGPPKHVAKSFDEEKGPAIVFADVSQSIYLADMSGDGLTDIVRIRNGEICYWPNLGYGRFGAKVTMDNSPWFDNPDIFDQRRIRVADIDGSGSTDIIYLAAEGLCIYFNQSGNSWSESRDLKNFPLIDNLTSVIPLDLLGNGTACLVWSSPLPNNSGQQMRYIDLMGGQKPHLLIKTTNNLGAETHVKYVSSTHFYVRDKLEGKPWITHLPFPVHVVKQVETFDYISRNHFITRYAYHHGYFDGFEREFRGFGMVEQWDTAELTAFTNNSIFSMAENISPVSQVPPVYTKTWFHTGAYSEQGKISNYFAGEGTEENPGEYYRAGKIDNRNQLLPDTLPLQGLSLEEEREACRALKGMMLRQEIYAQDNSYQEEHPYTVAEQNFTIRCLQPKADKRHGIFFTHPYETLTHHYERNPADPRISHSLKLEVDQYGNILKEVAIAYGRQTSDPSLLSKDQDKQTHPLITYIENKFTNPINEGKDYRTPLPSESQTYELTGYASTGIGGRYQASDFVEPEEDNSSVNNFKKLLHKFDEEINYEDSPTISSQRRLIEHVCTLYRSNDLTRLIPFDNIPPGSITPVTLESMALPGESYKLAFTPGLLSKTYQRSQAGPPTEILLPDLQQVLPVDIPNHQIADRGGYIEGSKIGPNKPGYWYIPTGRVFYSLNEGDSPNEELEYARQHFFMPHRYCDPFGATTIVKYDTPHKLLMVETCDSLGSRTIVGERNSTNKVIYNGNNYRVLQPKLVTDPNRNRTKLAFDALGMMVGTAVQGKDTAKPDNLDNFKEDLTQDEIDRFYNPGEDGLEEDLYALAQDFLQSATNRIIYDINSYYNSQLAQRKDPNLLKERVPVYNATLARETHINDLQPGQSSKIQISFSYSDGFGREIQKKLQAEPEKVNGIKGPLRWVGSGWVIYNNKGKPIQQYEPFFSGLPPGKRHQFEFGVKVGVSPILFYDPLDRVIATLHPNNTYEKVVFTPWWQANYDANDTVAVSDMIGKNSDETGDPRTDPHIQGFVREYFKTQPSPWKTWYQERISGAKGPEEASAANKAAKHANTPTTIHFDTLGRPFLTLIHNGFEENGGPIHYPTRSHLDIEGNQRAVEDVVEHNGAIQERIVMRYAYDMLGTRIYQASMEAGERWMLNDITGKPIRAWNSRNHVFRTEYDMLRRPISSFVTGADPANPRVELLVEHLIYGEKHPETEIRNLRGKPYLHLDQAGLATNEAHDFKGNLLRASRRLAREYKQTRDWRSANAILPPDPSLVESALSSWLEEETFTSHTSYDALNRSTQFIAPHSSQTGQRYNIIQPVYNEANLLEQLDVWLEHSAIPITLIDATILAPSPVGVNNIDYDAKGQRIRIDYKNEVSSRYNYDPNTFRLINLYTRRGTVFTEDCENHSPPPPYTAAPDEPPTTPSCGLQNLHYTYDPAGNITHIRDDAQQRIFFRNRIVDPSTDYTYDAVYRLIEATGREHLGQIRAPQPHSYNDEGRIGIDWSANEGNAMGTYIEKYAYDAVGNFLSMNHISTDSSNPGWCRNYHYNEASLLDKTQQSNRLSETKITNPNGANNILTESYLYDAHGNIVRMPHLANHPDQLAANMHWDYKDQLQQTDLGGGGVSYYVYDASGQRVRKVWEKNANLVEERIYLGGFEIFRSRNRNKEITLERETLHIMDDKQRIALVETRTQGQDPATQQLIRYQLSNHLGSSVVELNNKAEIISYEEYSPYGSTTYQAVRNQTETPKRYRYTSKERDEENGFYYHGARYYAAWLGRWTSTDPVSFEVLSFEQASHQPYGYVENKPVVANDPDGRAINFIAAAVGAAVGTVVGGAIEAGRQYVTTGRVNDWGAVGASAAGGAVSGAIAGLTMGASLAVQSTAAAGAGVVGGVTTRALTGQEQTARAVVQDAAIGLLTFGIVKGGSAAVSALRGAGTATLESGTQATTRSATSSGARVATQSSTRAGAASTTRNAANQAREGARQVAVGGTVHIDTSVIDGIRRGIPGVESQLIAAREKGVEFVIPRPVYTEALRGKHGEAAREIIEQLGLSVDEGLGMASRLPSYEQAVEGSIRFEGMFSATAKETGDLVVGAHVQAANAMLWTLDRRCLTPLTQQGVNLWRP